MAWKMYNPLFTLLTASSSVTLGMDYFSVLKGTNIASSYCNSVVQALFYTKPFRDAVINYPRNNVSPPPPRPDPDSTSAEDTPAGSITDQNSSSSAAPLTTAASTNPPSPTTPKNLTKQKSNGAFGFNRNKLNRTNSTDPAADAPPTSPPVKANGVNPTAPGGQGSNNLLNPYAPSPYSLNGAIASTSIMAQNAQKDPSAPPPLPSLPLDYSRNEEYGMRESLFTCLKDLFERIVGENGKSGVIAPMKLVEVLKRENGKHLIPQN